MSGREFGHPGRDELISYPPSASRIGYGLAMLLGKRALQAAVAVAGLVPVAAGLAGMVLGPEMIGDAPPASLALDSHYRYLSGLLLGIGLAFWSTIPGIELRGGRFRLLTAIVVAGGLGRLVSLCSAGVPGSAMLFALAMELGVTPLLAFWQYRLAAAERRAKRNGAARAPFQT